ncbi:hypothetical protein OMO38_08770 [Chryseobacterium sp. 09-1422]|uniref:Plasminogen-binding protein PgbA N-terminal domain-containing protein n=1 Tax=Chryseobacterium kimseyorum TaxID=2984028 RepID=A0ABT3HXT0_9FLAO|nr:hypothetical protein [Chryseobacterium kimseyorum]MCW3168619.1 hypothetical protein [Chryseobacterium kimseyorum]
MKKLTVLLLLIASAQCYFAQSLQFYTGKRDFLPIEILMEDGTTKTGFAQDFMLPDVATFTYLTKSSEKSANLSRKEVKFKSSKSDAAVQIIPVSDIKSLVYTNEDTQEKFQLDKRIVKEIDNNLELESEGRVLMLPLMEKGEINLYGYRSMFCKADFGDNFASGSNGNNDDCQLQHVMIYLSKPGDTFAVAPVDYNKLTPLDLFNMKSLYKKFYKAYEIVGADCPEFLAKVDEARKNEYFSNKTYKENKKATDAERKEEMKGKKGAAAAKINMRYKTELYTNMYKKLLKDYDSSCK